jgi:thymidylate synthase
MAAERDFGHNYGFQWRRFGSDSKGRDAKSAGEEVDQLEMLIEKIKKDPYDRKLIVSTWNFVDLPRMALAPCHFCFQVKVIGDKLNLLWSQRSVDVAPGLSLNIASYGK